LHCGEEIQIITLNLNRSATKVYKEISKTKNTTHGIRGKKRKEMRGVVLGPVWSKREREMVISLTGSLDLRGGS